MPDPTYAQSICASFSWKVVVGVLTLRKTATSTNATTRIGRFTVYE